MKNTNNDLLLLGASNAAEVDNSPKKVQKKRQRNEEVKDGVAKQLSRTTSSYSSEPDRLRLWFGLLGIESPV